MGVGSWEMGVGSFRKRMIKILEILKSQLQKSMAKINYKNQLQWQCQKAKVNVKTSDLSPILDTLADALHSPLWRVIARNEAIAPAVKQQREDRVQGIFYGNCSR